MNHIYKVIWNKATQSLVVVSELANSQGKTTSLVSKGHELSPILKTAFKLTALSSILMSMIPTANAAIAIGSTSGNYFVTGSSTATDSYINSKPYNYGTPNNINYLGQSDSNLYSGTLNGAQSISIGANTNSQRGAVALGDYANATGGLSLALGTFSRTTLPGSIALGTATLASGFNSFAAMRQAAATADFAIAVGTASNANATSSIALGSSAQAYDEQSIAIGSALMKPTQGSSGEANTTAFNGTINTRAVGARSIALGVNTSTTNNDSIAIGTNTKTNAGTGSIAMGWSSKTTGRDAMALGSNATAAKDLSVALGYNSTANGPSAIAMGDNAQSLNSSSIAIGNTAYAASNGGQGGYSQSAIAIGSRVQAIGNQSVALGAVAQAGEQATAIGNDARASGFGSIVIGGDDTGYSKNRNADPYTYSTTQNRIGYLTYDSVSGTYSNYRNSLSNGIGAVTIGVHGQALSQGSTAIGVYATAGDNGEEIASTESTAATQAIEATAIGAMSRAKSIRSSAIGYSADALGDYSTVIGSNSTANGNNSLALGYNSTANSTYSLAAGYNASANVDNSTAIGSSAKASGSNAIALGQGAQALNTNTISIGTGNIVSGKNSGAIGDPTTITGENSYSLGNDNTIDACNSFAIGNVINIAATAANTLAFGTNITIPTSAKTNNTAIGTSATIQGGENGIAFGTNATISTSASSSAIAIGNQSKVEAAVGGIAIGNGSTVSSSANNGAIALGQKTSVTGISSIALGNNASVTGNQEGSIAIGNNTCVTNTGQGSVAVGANTNVTVGNAVAVGDNVNVKGQYSIAIGSSSSITDNIVNATTIGAGSKVTQNYGTAVGNNASVSNYNGSALGTNASATAQNSVALGSNSIADREGWGSAVDTPYIPETANSTQRDAINGTKATAGAVSVGSNSIKRQIINVAAGSADSDAVNVAQLKAAVSSVNTAWNILENNTQKDVVNANDKVNFADGTGTTANITVDTAGTTSTVKYSVNQSDLTTATDGTVSAVKNGDNFATAEQVAKAINDSEKTTTVTNGSDKVNIVGTTTGTNTNYVVDLSQTTKDSLAKADNALQSWTAQVNGSSAKVVNQTNSTVNFVNGDNINITNDNGDIKVATSDNVNFTTVNATNVNATNVNSTAVTIGSGEQTTTLTSNGNSLDVGGDKITNVSNGTQDSDAVNLSQLNATNANVANNTQNITKNAENITKNTENITKNTNDIANNTANITKNTETINKGFNINADNGSSDNVQLGQEVKFTGDNNIITTVSDNSIAFALNKTLNLTDTGSVTIGGTVLNSTGLTIANGPSMTTSGIDAGGKTVTNVAAGVNSTDAVNLSQLNASKASVVAGNNVNVTATTNENGTVYTVNANTSTVSNGSDKVTISRTDTGNNTSNYAVDLSQAAKDSLTKADTALQSFTTTADDARAQTLNKDNTKANFISGNNIKLTPSTTGITVATVENVTFNNVNTTNFKSGDVIINNNGINAGNHAITNVANGAISENSKDAINGSQLYSVQNTANSAIQNFTTSVNDQKVETITKDNNDINFVNGTGTTARIVDTDITFDVNKATLTTANNGTVSSNTTGDTFATSTDVANAINNASAAAKTEVKQGDNIVVTNTTGDKGQTIYTVATTKDLNVTSVNAGKTVLNNIGLTITGGPSVTIVGIDAGNKTITNVANGTKDSDAVNLSQLNATATNVMNNSAWKITGNNDINATTVGNKTVSFNNGANTVAIVNGTNVTYNLADNITLSNTGSVIIGSTQIKNDSIQVGDKTTIGNGSAVIGNINIASNGTISGVTNGTLSATSTEAINGSQLYETNKNVNHLAIQLEQVNQTASAGWNLAINGTNVSKIVPNATVSLNNIDHNIVIAKDSNSNNVTLGLNSTLNIGEGTNVVTVDGISGSILTGNTTITGDNVKTTTLTTGNTTINNDGLVTGNVAVKQDGINAGGNKITGIANGDVSINSTDAINGSQLYNAVQNATASARTEITAGQNIVVNNSTGTNGQTIYTVETAKEVKFDNVAVGNVSINKDTNKVSGIANGNISANSTDAVNGSQLYATNQNITNNTNAIGNVSDTVNKGWNITTSGNTETPNITSNVKMSDTVTIDGGSNIKVKQSGNTISVTTIDTPSFNSITIGGASGVNISSTKADDGVKELSVGSTKAPTRITNVAAGVKNTDAANIGQLKGAVNDVNNRMNNMNKDLRAGIASAMASGNLYHATLPGKSMVAAGVGTYRGQSALSVGYSRLADNGKTGVKVSFNTDSQGGVGAAASVGYQW